MPQSEGREAHGARRTAPAPARDVSGSLTRQSLTRQSLLVAATTLIVDCLGFLLTDASHPPTAWHWGIFASIVMVDAALATPPRLSGAVAVAQTVVAVAGSVLLPGNGPLPQINNAGIMVSAYRAGAWLDRAPAVASLLCLTAGGLGGQLLGDGHFEQGRILLGAVGNALLPWLVGRYTTARRAYIAELEQRSERERHERRQALAEAIAEERSSIAHDLHDVISHHVSAISLHAGAARLRAGTAPDAVDVSESLTAVETSSRAAMADLRRLLDFLHGTPAGEDSQPGLDNLSGLLDTVRAVGLKTRVSVYGVPPRLPESLDIAAYRVVQEMLTNALRHGDGGVADVDLRYAPSTLAVTTTNPLPTGTRTRPDSPHRGLQGIRSRAALFNGSVAYGPTPDGTAWTTTVTFPLDTLDPS